jgi:hypothetical protein
MPAMSNDGMPPTAYAADINTARNDVAPIPAGPFVGQPVKPVAVGPAPMDAGSMTGTPPTISAVQVKVVVLVSPGPRVHSPDSWHAGQTRTSSSRSTPRRQGLFPRSGSVCRTPQR